MSSAVIQLLVLAGIAVFLILRLRNVLGTREGFEKPPVQMPNDGRNPVKNRPDFEVIEGGPDRDIIDHVPEGSPSADALSAIKGVEPDFGVGDFLNGARGAYEMILMAFESGDLETVRNFLGPDVLESFEGAIAARKSENLTVEASFVGIRDMSLVESTFDQGSGMAEMTVKYVAELTSVVRNSEGEIVEGDPTEIKRQRDVWTFGRVIGADDPNWQLLATGE